MLADGGCMSNFTRVSTGSAIVLVLVIVGVALRGSGGGPLPIDSTIMTALNGNATSQWTPVVDVLTLVFSPWTVIVWTALAAVILYVRDSGAVRAIALIASVASAGALCEALKVLVARPRPPVTDQLGVPETTYSFPSGHVTGTASLVIAFVALVARSVGIATRIVLWSCAAIVIVLVCLTRLYLGVHWISDVVAGIGVACAATLLILPAVDLTTSTWRSHHRHLPDSTREHVNARHRNTHAPSH